MSDSSPIYDQIGVNYASRRCPDPRWQAVIDEALLDDDLVATAMERLQRDLADGSWARRNSELVDLTELDIGYRLVIVGDQDDDHDE